MTQNVVVISLGTGSLWDGFPSVVMRLRQSDSSWMQVTGSLPAAPALVQLYRNWRALYESLHRLSTRAPIEIDPAGITNISDTAFSSLSAELVNRLNRWLANPEFQKITDQLQTHLQPNRAFSIVIESDEPEIWRLPWQSWSLVQTDYPQAEVVISTPDYPLPIAARLPKSSKTVRVLVILGDSTGINVQRDVALLQKLPNVEPTILVEPNPEAVIETLRSQPWEVFFFAGHSSSAADVTAGQLVINRRAEGNILPICQLQDSLREAIAQGLQLVIFNSCDGLGLARDLAIAQLPLPPMIVMREAVPDFVAQEFLKAFLQAFSRSQPFYQAVRQAREHLRRYDSQLPGASWLPVICQHPALIPPTWQALRTGVTPTHRVQRFSRRTRRKVIGAIAVGVSAYLVAGSPLATRTSLWGNQVYSEGHTLAAEVLYHLSTWLNPLYPNPHYNLGWLCENRRNDLDCALTGYRRSHERGLPEGGAQEARLLMRMGKDRTLVLQRVEQCLTEDDTFDAVKSACLGIKGWVFIEQDRHEEAKKFLKEAIALEEHSPHAQCLYAQVLEEEGKSEQARDHWQFVLEWAQVQIPEDDDCLKLAHQRLTPTQAQK